MLTRNMRLEYKRDYQLFLLDPASYLSTGVIDVFEENPEGKSECIARLLVELVDCSRFREGGRVNLLDVCEATSPIWLHLHSMLFDRRGVLLGEVEELGEFRTIAVVQRVEILKIAKEFEAAILYHVIRLIGDSELFAISKLATDLPMATLAMLGFKRIYSSNYLMVNSSVLNWLAFPFESEFMLPLDPNYDYTLELETRWIKAMEQRF